MITNCRLGMLCLVVVLLSPAVLAGGPGGAVAAQEATPTVSWTAEGELDLAAMPIQPSDLEAIGRPGYGKFYNGFYNSLDQLAAGEADFLGRPVEDVRAGYEALGFRRMFGVGMGVPSIPGEDSLPAAIAFANIFELGGAADGDAFFAHLADGGPDIEWSISQVEAPFELGDRAVVMNNSIDFGDGTFHELYVVFQTGNLFAAVGLGVEVYEDASTPQATPVAASAGLASPAGTVDELAALGRRQLDRIEDVQANGAPNLSDLVLRIGDDPLLASWDYTEGYRLINGEMPPYYAGFEDDILADPNTVVGAEAILELEERFLKGENPDDGGPYYVSRIYAFPDEAAATAFMDGREASLPSGLDAITGVLPEETDAVLLPGEATDLGDQSLAFSVTITDPEGSNEGFMIFVRAGGVVAGLWLEEPLEMTIDLLADIAAAQAACLEAGACPDAYPIPDGYLGEPASPEASPGAGAAHRVEFD